MTDSVGKWAFCDCDRFTSWQGSVPPEEQCAFPFKKNGKWHNDCINAHLQSGYPMATNHNDGSTHCTRLIPCLSSLYAKIL